MNVNQHQRAQRLIMQSRADALEAGDTLWLDAHLNECDRCAADASALDGAICSMRSLPTIAPSGLTERTIRAVRRRSEELQRERERLIPLWIAVAFSIATTVVTAPMTWTAFAWLGRTARFSDPVWQAGFLSWWFLPAAIVAAVLAWQRTHDHPTLQAGDHWRRS
jgi:anti-sigma factor RsiW